MHPNEYNKRRDLRAVTGSEQEPGGLNPFVMFADDGADDDGAGGGGGGSDDDDGNDNDDDAGGDQGGSDDDAGGEGKDKGGKPSDTEAKLLKEVMKLKKQAKDATKAAKEAADRLKDYEGIDPAEVRELKAKKDEADRAELEAKGEYQRILDQVKQQSEERVNAEKTRADTLAEQLAAAQRTIDELTVGQSFANSKFLSENTVLSGSKARILYGAHFEIEDGVLTAYDKPAGSKDRTPLVDADGEPLSFEAAIEKIVRADPDFERFAKSKLKPGAASTQSNTERREEQKSSLKGVSLIAANLGKLVPEGKK